MFDLTTFDTSGTSVSGVSIDYMSSHSTTLSLPQPSRPPATPPTAEPRGTSTIANAIRDNLYALARANITPELYSRLVSLAQARETDAQDSMRPLVASSLRSFLEFWKLAQSDAREPGLFLLPNGNIQIEWTRGKSILVIEFRGDQEIFFSLVDKSAHIDGREGNRQMTYLVDFFRFRPSSPMMWAEEQ